MNYIGITFGPITRITETAKSTKALWASSFFFSYLAKEIISEFKERNFVYPIVNKPELWNANNGVGCFPDRYVFQAEENDFNLLTTQINNVLDTISENITNTLVTTSKYKVCSNKRKDLQDSVLTFLRNYIKIYCFEKDITEGEKDMGNVANIFNPIFDLLEMQDVYNLKETDNYLLYFFECNELYDSFLVTSAFGDNKTHFGAIDTVARAECKKSPNANIQPMAYHQYIAVISADGDNMTKTINKMHKQGRSITELSKLLFEFGQEVIKIAPQFGARVIFSGGDDLLIFAPVKYEGATVFDLMENISTAFNEKMKVLPDPPTISFGVSITYMKFPMGEALDYAREGLTNAKEGTKNAIVSRLQKHSGQTSVLKLKKGEKSYQTALGLLRAYIDNELFLHSLTYWFEKNRQIIKAVLSESDSNKRSAMMESFLKNSLNEDVHTTKWDFIKRAGCYICECSVELKDATQAIDAIVSLLRLIHFINTKRHD